MSDTWLIPGGPALQENEDGAVWLVPGVVAVQEAEEEAPPEGAIPLLVGGCMGQTMGSNCNLMTG